MNFFLSFLSDIYSSPRLTESLENVISHSSANSSNNAENNTSNNNTSGTSSNSINNSSANNASGGSSGTSGGGGSGSSSGISVINATSLVSPSNLLVSNGLSSQRHRSDLLGTANLNLVSSTQSPTTTSTPSSILSQNLESPSLDVKSRQGKWNPKLRKPHSIPPKPCERKARKATLLLCWWKTEQDKENATPTKTVVW